MINTTQSQQTLTSANITLGSLGTMMDQMALDFGWDDSQLTVTAGSTAGQSNLTSTGSITLGSSTLGVGPYGPGTAVVPHTYITNGTGVLNTPWIGTDTLTGYIFRVQGDSKFGGDLVLDGDLKMGGVSLGDRLDAIEARLNILRPNADLESKWVKLRELGEEYRRLEAEIIDKQRVWDTLKA